LEGEEALGLLERVDELWVAKGRKVLRFDLRKGRPPDDELLGLMLGRSGKLRAPTSRVGRRLLVGYNEDLLREALL
jgi:arsenate reductase-like glutaredoxin family protein